MGRKRESFCACGRARRGFAGGIGEDRRDDRQTLRDWVILGPMHAQPTLIRTIRAAPTDLVEAALSTDLVAGCLRLLRLERASRRATLMRCFAPPAFFEVVVLLSPVEVASPLGSKSQTLASRPKAKHHCSLSKVQRL
jgi:hypothetical protein